MIEVSNETVIKKEYSTEELLQACCKALDDKKAEDLKILHLGSRSTVADYFVIATGTSSPHLRALRNMVEKALDEKGAEIIGMDTDCSSGWAVLDAGDIIFHMFTERMRKLYALESLWKDAEVIVPKFD